LKPVATQDGYLLNYNKLIILMIKIPMNLNQPRPEVALSGLTTSDAQDQNLNPSSTHSRLPVAQKELAGEKPQKPQLSEAENWNWPEPVSLKEKPVPIPFPVDSLPEVVKAAVLEVQSYTQAPLSIAVASALSSLSLAAQGQVNVAIDDHMIRPVSLFFLTIAESGERKSSTDRHFQQAIKEYEQQVSAASKVLQEDFDADLSIWEMKMGVLENQLKQNMKKGKLDSTELQEELKQLRKQRPKPPRSPRLLVNDISSEALVKQLSTWPTAGIFSAEAGYIFGSYALSNDKFMTFLTLLNQLWDGDPVSMDRKSVESMNLPNGRLTVNLLVQPQAFQDFQNKTFGMARGTGFLSRFLLSEPESTQGTRLYQIKKGMPSLGAYSRKMKELLEKPLPF
jgi:hypothetical protein